MKKENPKTFEFLLETMESHRQCEARALLEAALELSGTSPQERISLTALSAVGANLHRAQVHLLLEQGFKHATVVIAVAEYRRVVAREIAALTEIREMPFIALVATAAQIQQIDLVNVGVHGAAHWASGHVLPHPGDQRAVRRLGKLLGIEHSLMCSFQKLPKPAPALGRLLAEAHGQSFGERLQTTREDSGLSVADFLSDAGWENPTRTLCNRLSALTSQGRQPTENDRPWVTKLDARHPQRGLLAAYESELMLTKARPGAVWRAQAKYWNSDLETQWARVVALKGSYQYVHSNGGRPWGAASIRKLHQDFGYLWGFLVAAPNATDPRLNGYNVKPDELSFSFVALPEIWAPYLAFRAARAYAGRPCRGHAAILDIVASLIAPGKGPLWFEAKYFARLPGVLHRCPEMPTDYAGTDAPEVVRFRLACEETHQKLTQISRVLHDDPRFARPSREPARKIARVISDLDHYPLEALASLTAALERALPAKVTSIEDAILQRLLAALHIATIRPFRSRVWTHLTLKMIRIGPGHHASLSVPPALLKNGSCGAGAAGCFHTLPPRAAAAVRRYLEEGRHVLAAEAKDGASDAFLLNKIGQAFSIECLSAQLKRVAYRFAPDLFPHGLSWHDLRHLVACDMIRRFGRKFGGDLAAEALIIAFSTALKTYANEALDASRWSGAQTLEAAIEDAHCKARQPAQRQQKPKSHQNEK